MPAMQDDRLVGAILAGLPTIPAPDQPDDKGVLSGIANEIDDPWIYDGTPAVRERAYGTFQIGQKSSPINVRATGKDPVKVRAIAEAARREVARIDGVVDARIIQRLDYPEDIIDVDRAKAADLGLL